MGQRIYATKEQYPDFAEEPFDGSDELLVKRLRSASIEVEKLTRLARYATDVDGYPDDPDTADSFAEATCAIVEHWQDTDDPRGIDASAGAVKIGSVSLGTTSSGADSASPREKLARRIGDKAIDILANAGLLNSSVAHS
ncbi:hypothetical protein MN032_17825 [Agromyces atrinae]|uniref:hypothetical protein n=1 Tax=Agromyces atrinae TaxID=592376 RepID=UPI001F59FF83|nr:hypothetical protein [Agromyces atrinae]MCI2959547.1 hypothetical protein [Agromyces atrinae]